MVYAVMKVVLGCVVWVLGRPTVAGRGNVPSHGPVVVVANHASLIDGPVLASIWPQRVTFTSAAYLFKIPIVGALLRGAGAIPVQSAPSDVAGLKAALRVLERGGTLAIFPEGGIGPKTNPRPLQLGWAYLALRTGACVLPVVIKGSRTVLPTGARLPRIGRITVAIAPPWILSPVQHPGRDVLTAMNNRLFEQMLRMQSGA